MCLTILEGALSWIQTPFMIQHFSALTRISPGSLRDGLRVWHASWCAGVISEVLNGALLWALGRHLEPHLAAPFLTAPTIYFASGIIGSLASANLDAVYIVTGATNAICGLIGALYRTTRATFPAVRSESVEMLWAMRFRAAGPMVDAEGVTDESNGTTLWLAGVGGQRKYSDILASDRPQLHAAHMRSFRTHQRGGSPPSHGACLSALEAAHSAPG